MRQDELQPPESESSARLSVLYDQYFTVMSVETADVLDQVYALRYQVYCVEHAFLDPAVQINERERDQYDEHSVHAALIFRPTGKVAGCVRLILPHGSDRALDLPVRSWLNDADRARFDQLPRDSTAEISRYAVSKELRRRDGESMYPDLQFYDLPASETRRLVPHISLGLLRGVAALAAARGITHVAAAMAPSLLRLLLRFGITFELLGPRIDYHGERQACIASCKTILDGMARANPEYHSLVASVYRGTPAVNPGASVRSRS
jgi:N-acyl amino acid synthase of PEP-CTERM/exosortase system